MSSTRKDAQTTTKEKSIPQKEQALHFHKHGAMSESSKALTADMKPVGNPEDTERLQNLLPPPSENYEIPIQSCADRPDH
jgi:hypothetical protein